MSQASFVSCSSSIPSEITDKQDEEFIEELHIVDELYFTQVESSQSENLSDDDGALINFESDDSDSEHDDNLIQIDPSDEDNREYISQARFRNDSCGCKEFYGKPCSQVVSMDTIIEFREHCKELSRDELDLVIKSELFTHRRSGDLTTAKKHKQKDRERPFQEFYFAGHRVCRQTFCFAHGIEKKKLLVIAKSLDNDGLTPRVHGGKGRHVKHALGFTDTDRIKSFLHKYAVDNALPLPGRLPNFRNSQVLLLPSDKTAFDIHELYETLAVEMKYRSVSLRTFQRLWSELLPNIVVSKPCTDLCCKCQNYAFKISNSGHLTEEEKSDLLDKYNTHVQLAKEQRDYYRRQCSMSKENYINFPDEGKNPGNPPCSVETEMHYSWDYAQQVHFPHHAQQVGPIYFKTPRKCNVFGMCSEGSGKQTFYLVDEEENPGKGANSVVSMVHHYLMYYGHGETNGKFHFDNCSGQNKNNVVLWYALWRVLTGLHKSIEYSMMIVGHTKFEPDWHFGVWKVKWRNSAAETMEDIAESVNKSSRNGHNISQLVKDIEKPVIFFDWKKYLQQYFKTLKHISTYHHFTVDSTKPGYVVCKESCDSVPITVNLLKKNTIIPMDTMPNTLTPKGLDAARQWYLYEQIREFCYNDANKDVSCPKPTCAKNEVDLTSDVDTRTHKCPSRKQNLLN